MNNMPNDLSIFFLSYDEPNAEENWARVRQIVPHAKRIHGIHGLDAAYKECASQAIGKNFVTIDGDNHLRALFSTEITTSLSSGEGIVNGTVLSWSSRNAHNGLEYGNGGVKCWPTSKVRTMRTHELACSGARTLDFCWALPYVKRPTVLADVVVTASRYQAFRAGFREGVKLSSYEGCPPTPESIRERLVATKPDMNIKRLIVWCSVGADVPNGAFALFGARLGCAASLLTKWISQTISNYGWFDDIWTSGLPEELGHLCKVYTPLVSWQTKDLAHAMDTLTVLLTEIVAMPITTLDSEAARFFRFVFVNPHRQGRMRAPILCASGP